MKLVEQMTAPMPAGQAMMAVFLGSLACNIAGQIVGERRVLKQMNPIIEDQAQRLSIYDEALQVLLAEAAPDTLGKLNKNLEFWAIIRGRSARDS